MNDCVIRDVLVVPVTGEAPFRGWVEVRGESISAVGRGVANETGEQLIIEGGGTNGNLGQDVTPEATSQTFTVTDYKRAVDLAAGRARVERV